MKIWRKCWKGGVSVSQLMENAQRVFTRDNVVGKLDQLREITSRTQQPPGHKVALLCSDCEDHIGFNSSFHLVFFSQGMAP